MEHLAVSACMTCGGGETANGKAEPCVRRASCVESTPHSSCPPHACPPPCSAQWLLEVTKRDARRHCQHGTDGSLCGAGATGWCP